jgi:hypothetical protein
MHSSGRCPQCGQDLEAVTVRTQQRIDEERAPWHFKLLVVALVVYLGWRLVELFI